MGFYIVGMHRSGTSALAGLVSKLLGIELQPEPVVSNPLGQWERSEMRPALDLMLITNRSTWIHPRTEDSALGVVRPLDHYARRVFARDCTEPFLWKDPRLCLTLDYWLSLKQETPVVLFIHRDPLAVANSLAARNGWPLSQGLALWERTNRNAIARLRGRVVFCVGHKELMNDPMQILTSLTDWLDLELDQGQLEQAVLTIKPEVTAAPPDTAELSAEIESLATYLRGQSGPTILDLDEVPKESAATAIALGRAPGSELARHLYRSLRQLARSGRPTKR